MRNITVILLFALISFTGCAQKKSPVSESPVFNYDTLTVAVMKTNMGTIEIQLYPKETPKTVENFTTLASQGYYNGIIFHRVIENFMIQGGDSTGTGMGGRSIWGSEFADEFVMGLTFDKTGLLAMANRGPNTNTSQFFITTAKTEWLNYKHTIFGEVINGYDVVDKISKVKKGPQDKPVESVVIQDIKIEKRKKK
ncbi:MAG: peptidyl-prolyl cis-trans isomerase [Ignavibacteriaceae bacterium]|nr:MAG: peptidylprolyl isomerase [Chlorobiota bacterium]GJQ33170.1 MAG: peptidyl-prolyl cis-trans isomerase [Ignavibacteriaceae bacterium]